MAGNLVFQILGPIRILSNNETLSLGGPRQRAVLAMLLLSPDRVVSADRLVEAVWNGQPPRTSRTQIAICVAGLRKSFRHAGCDEEVIKTVPPGYVLVSGSHRIDAAEFLTKVDQVQSLGPDGCATRSADLLGEALSLWRGPALAGVSSELVEAAACQMEEQRTAAYEHFLELRLQLGQHRELVAELTSVVQERPLRDHARALLMLAQYRSGRRAESLEVFREARRMYIDELGLEPGPALQRLHSSILRGDATVSLEEKPPATAGGNVTPAQLPRSLPVFVGRAGEEAALNRLLSQRSRGGSMPIGVVTGPAGVGKTTAVVHWARSHASAFPDGQLFADLLSCSYDGKPESVETILGGFLRALGVSPEATPATLADQVALYRSLLGGLEALVLLDDIESLAQIEPLLPGSGTCCVVVTARRLCDVRGAVTIRLGRLSEPESAELLRSILGDYRVNSDPVAAARLGELCEGLPLAIHVAAARLATRDHWTVRRMVARLEDPRHRLDELSDGKGGVRASLEVSYHRLDPAAALMFRWLGLLRVRSYSVPLAAALLDVSSFDAENLLEQLIDAKMLEPAGHAADGSLAYRMSDLLRFFARERGYAESGLDERQAAGVRAHVVWASAGRHGCPVDEPCGSCFLIAGEPSGHTKPLAVDAGAVSGYAR